MRFYEIMIAYGQVGSGKTQSILGENGLLPQSIKYMLEKNGALKVSAQEVFGNDIRSAIRTIDVVRSKSI
eukprot:UN03360